MSGQAKYFAKTKYINFQIEDEELFEAYNNIWKRMKKLIKKGFNNEPTHDEKSPKTEVKSIMVKQIHMFMVIKCQKKMNTVLVC